MPTAEQIDAELKAIYRALAEGRVTAEAAGAAEEALHARRAGRGRARPADPPRAATAHGRRRPKVFGYTYGRPLDRNERARLLHRARCFMRRTAPGRAYGELTAKHVQVFETLVYGFLNSRDGRCFPSLTKLAERAGCAVSTVQLAIAALERGGLLSWVHRLKRLWVDGRWRVHRTSNGYAFDSSDTETRQGSPIQVFSSLGAAFGGDRTPSATAKEAFGRGRRKDCAGSGAEKQPIGRQ
jgi:Helix-turn-helix domain